MTKPGAHGAPGSALAPAHGGMLICAATAARRAGAYDEARDGLWPRTAGTPNSPDALVGHALSRIGLGEEAAYAELGHIFTAGVLNPRWEELGRVLGTAPPSAARSALLLQLEATYASVLPPRLLALVAEAQIAGGARDRARATLAQAETLMATIDDPEILRRLALAAAAIGEAGPWAKSYALYCTTLFASAAPVRWPRRSAGGALRVAYLLAPELGINVGNAAIPVERYLRAVIRAIRARRAR